MTAPTARCVDSSSAGPFDSTMHLSLEVRGALLIRQVHHWAALVFVAAVALQLLRMFLTRRVPPPAHHSVA
ncbi:hypothetical protein GCM10020219_042730 [Nonomuraea dietziae]